MTVSSIRSDETWIIEQLSRLRERRPELVDAALDRLLTTDPDLRWAVVVGAYMDRRINLGKAAELLGMHELELRERFLELGIPIRLGPTDVIEAKAEVEAVRLWRQDKDI
ncbi:MAG: UPF0175 family protein [Chloroflexi bacterium]|nr:UPF0175 family protein [Chloroflexota bacterium]